MVIKNGYNGLLVPLGDKEGLMKAMDAIACDAKIAEKLGRNAAIIKESLSEEKICSQWINLIESV